MVNIDDIDRFARLAARTSRTKVADYDTRADLAWSAIAERAFTDPEATKEVLVRVGQDAIDKDTEQRFQMYGRAKDGEMGARFAAYWVGSDEGFADRLTDRIAVSQVLAVLPDTEFAAITAVANCYTYQAAAASLGIAETALMTRISKARKRLRRHWFSPETPPPHTMFGCDERAQRIKPRRTHCADGHEFTPENTYERRHGGIVCRTCQQLKSRRAYEKKLAKRSVG